MLELLLRFAVLLAFLSLGVLLLLLLYAFLRRLTPYQRMNRITVMLTSMVFLGILFFGYNLAQALIGSALALLLLRIAYIIVLDTRGDGAASS